MGRAADSQQLIAEVGMDIERLSNHSDAVLEMSTQIATSSEEQSSVAEEITRNLDKVRHEASRVEESASAAVAGTTGLREPPANSVRRSPACGSDPPAGHRPDGLPCLGQLLGTRETARPDPDRVWMHGSR